MGTVGYMSPEQVRGKNLDHRSDIFSFGVILYEMLRGRRTFTGESAVEVMNAILKEEPEELTETNTKISPQLEKIVRRCLEKKAERRFQSTSDLGFALEALATPSSSGSGLTTAASAAVADTKKSIWQARLPWVLAGAMTVIAAVAVALMFLNRSSTADRAIWLSFSPPPNLAFSDKQNDWAVISPDGQKIAFTAFSADGKSMLYVSELNSRDARLLPGSENALEPFWSPDSRSIAFGSQGKLKRVEISGGNSKALCDAARMTGGAWSKNGVIVFGPDYGQPLFQVPAAGGEPKQVTFQEEGEGAHRYANFLPDGKHFLFTRSGGTRGLWVGSLDSQDLKQIMPESSYAVYSSGQLVYVRNQVLVAQTFDAGSFQLSGDAVPIVTGVEIIANGQVRFSVSENGVLIFQGKWEREYQLVWFDREGKQVGAIGDPALVGVGYEPRLSPDGKRIVMKRDRGIWVTDLNGQNGIRLEPGQMPVWSPDSNRVAFAAGIQGRAGIFERAANGVGEPELLLSGSVFPKAWTLDRRFLIYMHRGVKTRGDIWVLPRFGDAKEFPILNSASDELEPEISRDGRWLAYISDESGSYEIYVQSLTAEGRVGSVRKRISTSGGLVPNWSRDGKELFYVAGDGQMMSVAVNTTGAEFEYSPPKALFKTRMLDDASVFHEFDVSPDGQRFLIGTMIGEQKAAPPTVILNWPANVKK
jgi:Tol biopolymer transport system component